MLYLYALLRAVSVHEGKPLLHAFEKFHGLAELAELVLAQLYTFGLGVIVHKFHIRQHIRSILAHGQLITLRPELLRGGSDGLDEAEFLHIAGGQSAVEIINQCYYRSFHN